MTSPFQWIIDNAVNLQVNKRPVVATTTARDQTVRATSRGGRVWRFDVTPSPGARWSESRGYIEKLDKAATFTTDTINFAKAGLEYVFGYLGDATNYAGASITVTQGSDVATITGMTVPSGFKFKAGDLVQPSGSNRVYSIVNDVPNNSNTVLLNRPVLDASGTSSCIIGKDCQWSVICTSMPDYRIVNYDRIEWSGNFVFIESLA